MVTRRRVLGGLAGGVAGAPLLLKTGAWADTNPSIEHTTVAAAPRRSGKLREYWLQVDAVRHNTVPTGRDEMMGVPITVPTTIWALVFRAFTPHWGAPLDGSSALGPNTGFPGPVIRAEVGDRVRVHLRNNDTHYRKPHSLHVHGLRYTPSSDGSWNAAMHDPSSLVRVGHSYTYEYEAVDDSEGTWPYHDHSIPFTVGPHPQMGMGSGGGTMEIGAELGLMGHVIVTAKGARKPDREQYVVMHDLYADDIADIKGDIDCFNGRAFLGNTPTFRAKAGERVRWHIIALGSEFHVFHIHGHRWKTPSGTYTDVEHLGPAMATQFEFVEDNPGKWLYHCHVIDHMIGGMIGWYQVDP